MTTTFPTEEMTMERGAALVRMAKLQRIEEAKLRRDLDAPIWRDWVFWVGVVLSGGQIHHDGTTIAQPSWPLGLVVMIIALDRVSRRRSRASRELKEFKKANRLLPKPQSA